MESISICVKWYEEIKNIVPMENAYFVTEGAFAGQVEVDILDADLFRKVSIELGWME